MRLDKFLAHSGGLTRTEAQRAIRAGEVTVDGRVVRDPARHVGPGEQAYHHDRPLRVAGPRYFMLHKPAGYICTTEDGAHPTVLDLMAPEDLRGLHTAGRLDLDTTGLVLVTDDGAWSHRITAPRHKCEKAYRVTLEFPLTPEAERQLTEGVRLHGDEKSTRPAVVERIDERTIRLTIVEGRYHQVKRMLAAVGNRLMALHRERIGPIQLDETLQPGGYRLLTAAEIGAI